MIQTRSDVASPFKAGTTTEHREQALLFCGLDVLVFVTAYMLERYLSISKHLSGHLCIYGYLDKDNVD